MMNIPIKNFLFINLLKQPKQKSVLSAYISLRLQSSASQSKPPEETELKNNFTETKTKHVQATTRGPMIPPDFRHIYPEFLPNPFMPQRNPLREKLERMDMLNRRSHIDIPEFYVGSIMAVTSSDEHSVGKTSKFVGICIDRDRSGLRSRFVLRNVIDHQGIEVQYEMYDPTIQKIEVLRLEKRLDHKLYYLRDALPEYSTFDANMEPKHHPEGEPIPVNTTKVEMRPRPWVQRWERQELKGVANIDELINEKIRKQIPLRAKPWEKYDLMLQYRKTIPEEEQSVIYAEVFTQLTSLQQQRKIQKRKRAFVKPKKTG